MGRSGVVHVLIDAHNVLYHDPELRRLMGDPESARRELERLLAGQRQLVLFYDGGPGGEARSLRRQDLAIER